MALKVSPIQAKRPVPSAIPTQSGILELLTTLVTFLWTSSLFSASLTGNGILNQMPLLPVWSWRPWPRASRRVNASSAPELTASVLVSHGNVGLCSLCGSSGGQLSSTLSSDIGILHLSARNFNGFLLDFSSSSAPLFHPLSSSLP